MGVTWWDHIDASLDGKLEALLRQWYVQEGLGTPAIAKELNALGFPIEQRTVWRWLKQKNITNRGGDTQ